ncbi:hypothetical protein GYA54_00775 [Candidatus Kuenenbacteria bacterium]|nr:hypothetical protein [Candidatus Kuenenbacteria bacterium]
MKKMYIIGALLVLAGVFFLLRAYLFYTPRNNSDTTVINTTVGPLTPAPDTTLPTTLPPRPAIPHLWEGQQGLVRIFVSVSDTTNQRSLRLRAQFEDSLKSGRGFRPSSRSMIEMDWAVEFIPLNDGSTRAIIERLGRDCDWGNPVLPDEKIVGKVLRHILPRR